MRGQILGLIFGALAHISTSIVPIKGPLIWWEGGAIGVVLQHHNQNTPLIAPATHFRHKTETVQNQEV